MAALVQRALCSFHRHAYNIRINEVNTIVMQALVEVADCVPALDGEFGVKLLRVARELLPVIKNYIRDSTSQLDCLRALEEQHLRRSMPFTISLTVKMIKLLYDEDVLEEDCVLHWFSQPTPLSGLIHAETKAEEQQRLRKEDLLDRLINWLREAEEETESE